MNLTDLQGEGDLEELGEEAIEQRQRRPDLVLPEERRGEARLGDDVGELAKADIDVDAGRMQDPPPLSTSSVRLDEEDFPGKVPRSRQILLRLLTAPLEVLELLGKRFREVAVDACIADEGVDVLADEMRSGTLETLPLDSASGNTR